MAHIFLKTQPHFETGKHDVYRVNTVTKTSCSDLSRRYIESEYSNGEVDIGCML